MFLQHHKGKKGHVETFNINPKCVKLGELYGETDPNTFEWTDGLIATATRKFARESISVIDNITQATRPPTSLAVGTEVPNMTKFKSF